MKTKKAILRYNKNENSWIVFFPLELSSVNLPLRVWAIKNGKVSVETLETYYKTTRYSFEDKNEIMILVNNLYPDYKINWVSIITKKMYDSLLNTYWGIYD